LTLEWGPGCRFHDTPKAEAPGSEGDDGVKIEIIGMGCPKCISAEENLRKALQELSLKEDIEKATGKEALQSRGITSAPAFLIDGKLLIQGRVPTVAELKALLARV
jgi:small redox-active disulfide protein 2